jgi:hypothetical protein
MQDVIILLNLKNNQKNIYFGICNLINPSLKKQRLNTGFQASINTWVEKRMLDG